MTKEEYRLKYKSLRKQLNVHTIEELSLSIANNTLQLPIWEFSNYHIFLTIDKQKEINTEYLLHILQGRDKSIIVPKVLEKNRELTHLLLQDNTPLKVSNFGVPEPVSGISIHPTQIDVVFIPLLAYDKKGNRLGYGGGYYDRFLSLCKPDTKFIGLSFFEPEEELPIFGTDIPLHYCITPHNMYTFFSPANV